MKFVLIAAAAAALLASAPASADKTLHLDMSFVSGAQFDGDVTFLDDYSALTNVSGTLTDYQYEEGGYTGAGSTSINWIWSSGSNWISGDHQYADWLMDGPGDGYNSYGGYGAYILLAYDYSSGTPALLSGDIEADGYYLNSVNATDQIVSGQFSSGAVPEPASWALMLGGFGMVGGAMRSRRKTAVSFG